MKADSDLNRIKRNISRITPKRPAADGELVTLPWPTDEGEPKEYITFRMTKEVERALEKIYGEDS